jgi:hypothetical protein
LVQTATAQSPGIITISVPEDRISSGEGFGFALPAELVSAAAVEELQVSRMDGGRLPSWLKYMRRTTTFKATSVPSEGLPVELLVRSGAQSWTLRITARANE